MVSQQTSARKILYGQRVSAADVTQNAMNAMRLARMTDRCSHSNYQQKQPMHLRMKSGPCTVCSVVLQPVFLQLQALL
jgi:hypothetical protein